ncbi:MAG: chemotaxis protein CheD [Pseudomonadota bacterium]
MRDSIDGHSRNVYLKPGEVIVSRHPILVSTILGSCIAVTMFSPAKRIGAICHAMYPCNPTGQPNVQYVDSAIYYVFGKMMEYTGKSDLTVKLFGGARVLSGSEYMADRMAVGEQNISQAKKTLAELGLAIATSDIGGLRGRKLLFSIKTGDIYLRRLKEASNMLNLGE